MIYKVVTRDMQIKSTDFLLLFDDSYYDLYVDRILYSIENVYKK